MATAPNQSTINSPVPINAVFIKASIIEEALINIRRMPEIKKVTIVSTNNARKPSWHVAIRPIKARPIDTILRKIV
ncbi:MAG TPA: hypothetical protein VIQ31_09920 [Phormidium sp.]